MAYPEGREVDRHQPAPPLVVRGGEAAKNLMDLYEYLHYRLVQANIKKDAAMVEEVLGHLRELRKTWDEAIRIAKREKSTNDEPNPETETPQGRSISV